MISFLQRKSRLSSLTKSDLYDLMKAFLEEAFFRGGKFTRTMIERRVVYG